MKYLVQSEEPCGFCNGKFEKPNPEYGEHVQKAAEIKGYDPSDYADETIICKHCSKGIIRKEVDLEEALEEILRNTPSALANDLAQSLNRI